MENSVAVTSVSQPGIIFGLNDSGHQPRIFAFDSSGRHRGVWSVLGARNRDSEAAALAPCQFGVRLQTPGSGSDPEPGVGSPTPNSCLYIGDVGDNDARRPYVTIYRVPEPAISDSAGEAMAVQVEDVLNVRYPDRPHDVEAMYVGADGSMFLITKRRLLDGQRRPRRALIFKVPRSYWDSSGTVVASLVDSLPIVPGERQGGQISDASLSPDGSLLAVRTYADVYLFEVDSVTQLPKPGQTPVPCTIRALRQRQGEGVAWWWDGRRLVLTSEGSNAPLWVVECPLPMS